MTNGPRRQIRILALIAALGLVGGCKEHDQLKKEAPALARANLRVDRIAVAGVVSEVAALPDTSVNREKWSVLIGNHFARNKFGALPILSSIEVRDILGPEAYGALLDRYKDEDGCAKTILADLGLTLEGRARFIVFGTIQEDVIEHSETESEDVAKGTKSKTMTTTRTVWVRLRFYDLSDQQLAWDHRAFAHSATSKTHDMSDFIAHSNNEGFLGGLIKSAVNSTIKPEPKHPPAPGFEDVLADAFDSVGEYLKPAKKK